MTDFIVVDFETANSRFRSICEIGWAKYSSGALIESQSVLIDPQDYFDDYNIEIHGITPKDVAGQATFGEFYGELQKMLSGQIVVCHTPFDRTAMRQACAHHGLSEVDCRWLDSARVARRAWNQFSRRGFGLASLAEFHGIEFRHHSASEDARAAGEILLKAINDTGVPLSDWFAKVEQGISPSLARDIRRTGDGDGPLVGQTLTFTGALEITRHEAADMTHIAGGAVIPNVTKDTTILVVGEQDLVRLRGAEKSSKHRKAEEMNAKGASIRIIGENDFLALCAG